jgi:VIT1/CCC1 family predicted Fe2+/Mn2+ transporter
MAAPRTDVWLENLVDELDGALLYEGLAATERDPARAEKFRELAAGERNHAAVWAKKLAAAAVAVPPERPSGRTRMLLWLARRLGTAAVLPLVVETEASDADKYTRQGGDAAALAKEEVAHREVLVGMEKGAQDARSLIARRERWHRLGRGGGIRAAIFGMNDGIVSNLSLVLGVAGAGVPTRGLIVTGLAGLLAGACSMAVGEYTSVASQRDLLLRQIAMERREIAEAPEEEAAELVLILQRKGLTTEHAARAAADILKDPEAGLDTLVREELGLDPSDLGSPFVAAGSSFFMFTVGALIPLLPLFFGAGRLAPLVSTIVVALVLAGVGSFIGVLSGTSPWRTAGRMVGLAAIAAGVTWGIGHAVGAALG